MRVEVLAPFGSEATEGDVKRDIGAVVVRAARLGGVNIDLGPADGAPFMRIVLSAAESTRLCSTLQAVIGGRDEEIMIAET